MNRYIDLRRDAFVNISFFLYCCVNRRDLHSFPTRRSSDLGGPPRRAGTGAHVAEPDGGRGRRCAERSEEHTSELQSPYDLVCRLLLEKKKKTQPRLRSSWPSPPKPSSVGPRTPPDATISFF